MKHYVNFMLLFCFIILVGSAALRFLQPFSLTVTSIHIVFGTAVLLLVGMHLASRLGYFRRMLAERQADPSRLGRPRWRYALIPLLPCAYLLAACFLRWKPVPQLLELGHEAKNRAIIFRPEADTAIRSLGDRAQIKRQTASETSVLIEIEWGPSFDPASYFSSSLGTGRAQIAVWAETTTGSLIETFFVSEKCAYTETPEWAGEGRPRVDILPIWRHRFTLVSGVEPDGDVNSFAGATPDHSFSIERHLTEDPSGFYLCVEVNAPNDDNRHYHADQPATADGYSAPGVGQPSVYYSAFIDPAQAKEYYLLEFVGHGGSSSQDTGGVYYDSSEITTARHLIEKVLVRLRRPPLDS